MEAFAASLKSSDVMFLLVTALVAVVSSLITLVGFYYWFRREQRRMHKRHLHALTEANRNPEDLFLTGRDTIACGELVAQFRVNHGKRVVSLLESEGKRYIHVDGDLSPNERTKMVRYLKSEGFMS